MSEYKRFVSYIYAYDGGVKSKNVGFAKMEVRNGECRININIKGVFAASGKELEVYFFHREQEMLLGTGMGSFSVKNGTGEFRAVTPADNIGGSGLPLEEMGGILLRHKDEETKVYASGWDDHAVVPESFIPVNQTAQRKEEPLDIMPESALTAENEELSAAEILPVMEAVEEELARLEASMKGMPETQPAMQPQPEIPEGQPVVQPQPEIPEAQPVVQPQPRMPETQPTIQPEIQPNSRMPEIQPTIQPEIQPNPRMPETQPIIQPQPRMPEVQPTIQPEIRPQPKMPEAQPEIPQPEMPEVQPMVQPQQAPGGPAAQKQRKMANKQFLQQEYKESAKANIEKKVHSGTWERMEAMFPKVVAFEDEPRISCLKIDLKDLEYLPRENWGLANNSFLLHGYYNFRYLILARTKDGEYMLGVPGMFHNNERFMAAMFGFDHFKPVKDYKPLTGHFGYWYQWIDI